MSKNLLNKTFLNLQFRKALSLDKQTVLSSITANNLNVNVQGNTNLKGSLVASGNFDENGNFEDNKNLSFITNTLTYENMSNSSYSSNQSLGASANYNLESTKVVDNKTVPQQGGVSSVSYNASNGIDVNASKTLATLGQGNINIKDTANSDDLSRLNTDTTKINKDLYSASTGTKVDATLDTRLLTTEGRKQIAEDYERTKRLGGALSDVVTSDALKITDTFDHIADVQKDLDVQKALALKDNGKTVNILENQSKYSVEQIDKALNDYAQIYAQTYNVNIEDAKTAILGKYGSTYTNGDNTNSNIYLDKTLNQNALQTANTLGHEVAHVRQNQGQTYLRETTDLQEEYSNIFGNYSANGLEFSSYAYNNVKLNNTPTLNNQNLTNQDINTLKANTNSYVKDEAKANSGDGRLDDRQLSSEEKVFIKNNVDNFIDKTKTVDYTKDEASKLLTLAGEIMVDKKAKENFENSKINEFTNEEVNKAIAYLTTTAQGKEFKDASTQLNQKYFTSTDYQYTDSSWNPNEKSFVYLPTNATIRQTDDEILANQITQQTWYERQKGAEERFDTMSDGGHWISVIGKEIKNPILSNIGNYLDYGGKVMKYAVTPDAIKDYQIYNEIVPKLFQVEPAEGGAK